MAAKDKGKEDNFDKFVSIVSSNSFAYAMSAIALIACFYTIYNVEDYQQRVNNHWMNFINEHCSCSAYYKPNITFELMTPKEMIQNFGQSRYNTTVEFDSGRPAEQKYIFPGGIQIGNESFN